MTDDLLMKALIKLRTHSALLIFVYMLDCLQFLQRTSIFFGKALEWTTRVGWHSHYDMISEMVDGNHKRTVL